MYESFYGLTSKPFQLNPDHSFYFDSKQHRRAKAYLDYGVMRNEGFIVITGEVGAGKTTLLSGLLDRLNRSNVVVGQLVTTQLDAEDTLRMVGAAFGFNVKGVSKSELLITLEAFLISQASRGKRCLLIVDEAQNLTARAVEELRMLSNYQLGTQSLLQSFLVGQPEFREILQRPEMKQFRQRVAASCHIGPLDTEDTQHYIEHRLKCAGATDKPTFDPATFEAIFNASQGIPRRINTLCDRLLLTGYLAEKTHLTAQDVSEVEEEFAKETGSAHAASEHPAGLNGVANGVGSEGHRTGIALDAGAADSIARELSSLSAQQQGGSLQRLEQSLLRLETINLRTLELLQRMVGQAAPPRPSGTDE
jgi:putative secretion ATPase (PEP-CTERM system associated)